MGFQAVIESTGNVVEVVKNVTEILKALNEERSAVIKVKNLTTKPLKLVSYDHDDGGFAELPSEEILPGHVDVFGSHDEGLLPEARGHVTYESEDGFLFKVDWENSGSVITDNSECNATVASSNGGPLNFEATHLCGSGDQAQMEFSVEPGLTRELILRKDHSVGDEVFEIVAIKTEPHDLLTAVRAADGNLKLISWRVGNDGSISNRGTPGEAGEASNIDIARGRLYVTACQTAGDSLKLISWELLPDGSVERRGDSGDQAGEAGNINIVALSDNLFVTSVSTADDELKLITWALTTDNQFDRLGDSEDQAGEAQEISLLKIPDDAAGNHRVITSVRAESNDLVLITWEISPDGRRIRRRSFNHSQAGEISRICSVIDPFGHLVTSVRSGSGDLVLITWRIEETGNLTRLSDSHGQAGEIDSNALISRPGGVLSAVGGDSGLKLISWQISSQGAIQRMRDSEEQADDATVIALCTVAGEALVVTAVARPIRINNIDIPDPLTLITWDDHLGELGNILVDDLQDVG